MIDRSVLSSDDVQAARAALEALLTDCQGNVTLASRRAGIERQSMHRLLKRHGLSASDYRPRGGGSIIARAALKNLGTQLPSGTRTLGRDFSRSAVREVAARTPERTPAVPEVSARDVAARAREIVVQPHHRPSQPYQTDLGRAALHALLRKVG